MARVLVTFARESASLRSSADLIACGDRRIPRRPRCSASLPRARGVHSRRREWSESENAPNAESNARFRRNGVKVACAAFGWWRPRRYKVMWDAWKFARICQRFGWSAWRAPYEARQEGISPEAEGRAAKQTLAGCILMARPSPTGLATSTSRSSHGEWSGTAHQPQQEKSTMNGKINTPRTVCKAMFRAETIGRKLESFCGSS